MYVCDRRLIVWWLLRSVWIETCSQVSSVRQVEMLSLFAVCQRETIPRYSWDSEVRTRARRRSDTLQRHLTKRYSEVASSFMQTLSVSHCSSMQVNWWISELSYCGGVSNFLLGTRKWYASRGTLWKTDKSYYECGILTHWNRPYCYCHEFVFSQNQCRDRITRE